MNKYALILFLCLLHCSFQAQSGFRLVWPIDSPRVITGNYGELRPNHFHNGIDFSTNGQVNLQVYAVAEGYVSRIKVSATGYGKSVYITHPGGRVTVYAHLNSYSLKIAEVVKKEQYAKRSYEVELFPKPGMLSIRKGEIIGLSGNTGGSTGPHLHFEIRDEKTETPLNPLTFFKIKDAVPPVVQKVGFYDLSDTCFPQFIRSAGLRFNGDLLVSNDTIELPSSNLGFAFSGSDRCVVNGNQNNIYSAVLYLDGTLIYSHTLNNIDFADNRYVNEFSEVIHGLKFQKCFLPTLYPRGLYGPCLNKGRISLSDRKAHQLQLVVKDESGNEQRLKCYIKAASLTPYRSAVVGSDQLINCDRDFKLRKNNLSVVIPAKTLFYSVPLTIGNTLETSGKLVLQPFGTNFRNAATIGFKVPARFFGAGKKLILKTASSTYAPVSRRDSVFYDIKNFGTFQLLKDTIGPSIKNQLTERQLKKSNPLTSLSFLVTDKGSGLQSYSLFLNNEWVIGEYDAKSDLITYYFDEASPSGKLEFRLEAEDKAGNRSTFNVTIHR